MFHFSKTQPWIAFLDVIFAAGSHQHTPTHWINSIGLFIAQSHDRKHIVPYLLGLVACSACIIASFWAEAAVQPLWMKWVSARGWEMALIPLWCHSRDKEKRGSFMRTSHSSFCLSPSLRCAHPRFSCPVMDSNYRPVVTHPPPPTQSPLTHSRCSLAIFPSPPCPACPAQPHRLWPRSQKSQFHAHALAHRRRSLLI